MIISASYDDSLRHVFDGTARTPKQYYTGPFSSRTRHLLVDNVLNNLTFLEYDIRKAQATRKESMLFRINSQQELDLNNEFIISSLSFENETTERNSAIAEETASQEDLAVLEKYGVALDGERKSPSPQTRSFVGSAMTKSSTDSGRSQASAEQKLIMSSNKPKKKASKKKAKKSAKKGQAKIHPGEEEVPDQHYKGNAKYSPTTKQALNQRKLSVFRLAVPAELQLLYGRFCATRGKQLVWNRFGAHDWHSESGIQLEGDQGIPQKGAREQTRPA